MWGAVIGSDANPPTPRHNVRRTVVLPGGRPVGTRALDLEGELARRGIPMPQEIDVAPST